MLGRGVVLLAVLVGGWSMSPVGVRFPTFGCLFDLVTWGLMVW